MADYEISGPAQALEAVRAARMTAAAGKTLGTMAGELLGSYVVPNEVDIPIQTSTDTSEANISIGSRLQLSDADFARTENDLRKLVLLRNNLVNHIIEQHDSGTGHGWTLAGTLPSLKPGFSDKTPRTIRPDRRTLP